MAAFVIERNRAGAAEICAHLHACDASFIPALSTRVDVDSYAAKIAERAERFEAWADDRLVGLVAAYCNEPERRAAFVTSVSVIPAWHGRGLASRLLQSCIEHVRQAGFARIELEVDKQNTAAARLYRKHGFVLAASSGDSQTLHLPLERTPA